MNDSQPTSTIPTKLESMSKNELIKLAKKYIVLKNTSHLLNHFHKLIYENDLKSD
jgi:hypothetical protein